MSDETPQKDRSAEAEDTGPKPKPPLADDKPKPSTAAEDKPEPPVNENEPKPSAAEDKPKPPAEDKPEPSDTDEPKPSTAEDEPKPPADENKPSAENEPSRSQPYPTEDRDEPENEPLDPPDPAHDIEQRRREAGVDHRFPFGRPGQPLGTSHPFTFGFIGALGVMTAYLLVQAAASAKSVLIMIVVAMFLAVGLNPAVERLRKFGLPRGWAVAAVFLGVLLFFAGFVASLVPPLTEQVSALTRNVPAYIEQLQNNPKIAEWDRRYRLLEQAQEKITDPEFQQDLATRAYEVGRQAISGTFQTLTILILTLYFLSALPQVKTFSYRLAPRTRRARVALLGDEILDRIGGYVAGQFTIAFIAGVTSYIFLEILGVPYALALALIVAVTDLIPLIGATIGAAIVTLVAFLTGVPEGIACIVFYLVYQQVENYLVYPRVMKRTVDVAPAVTVVAALIGATLLGVIGALVAIPTAAAISLVIREVFLPRQETL